MNDCVSYERSAPRSPRHAKGARAGATISKPAQRRALLATLAVALVVRIAVSLFGYSGEGRPRMYGDFEAQRHWMEVTANLPLADWYRNTTDNDLLYWGLDYPPLTAYHSYVMGKVFQRVHPPLVQLHRSRGIEGEDVRLIMRSTVWLGDLLILFPAAVLAVQSLHANLSPDTQIQMILYILLQPALVLIDHGHFQYNGISLGLVLLSIAAVGHKKLGLGAAMFCMSLAYKHMGLYYAPAYAGFYFGHCWRHNARLWEFVRMAAIVVASVASVLAPFALTGHGVAGIWPVIERLFPFNRGLYEDKVANVWCTLSTIVKLHQILPLQQQILVCTITTSIAFIPSLALGILAPSSENLVLSMAGSSLSFFLFSFQVHEKSFLLPLLPLALLAPLKLSLLDNELVQAFAAFSMFPLLYKDGLGLAYTCCLTLYVAVFWGWSSNATRTSHSRHWLEKALRAAFLLAAVTVHACHLTLTPPPKFPDLFSLAFTSLSCAFFATILLAVNASIVRRALGKEK